MRVRRTKIDVCYVEAKPSWEKPKLLLSERRGDQEVQVIITISNPWDLQRLRGQLDRIGSYWKEKAAIV